jgi:hypothetical protein
VKEVNRKLIKGQEEITTSQKNIANDNKLDTSRLLKICLGLATGVQRLDGRQIQIQKGTTRQYQKLVVHQVKTKIAIERMSKSLKSYAMRTNIIVGQLLHL